VTIDVEPLVAAWNADGQILTSGVAGREVLILATNSRGRMNIPPQAGGLQLR